MSTITAILEADADGTLHLPLPPDAPRGRVKVIASVEALPVETPTSRGTPLEALKELRKRGGLRHLIPDPLAWQRKQRRERWLPGHD
jgi:hypothetical protein